MPTLDERAGEIRAKAARAGLKIFAHDQIVSVSGRFTPGDKDAYVAMERNALAILGLFRQTRAGSTWGTDSGSVGGALALEDGKFLLHRSGIEKRLASRFYGQGAT